MFYFRCKLIFEKKKKEQAHTATKTHKLTHFLVPASHWITALKEEIHAWYPWIACLHFMPHCT